MKTKLLLLAFFYSFLSHAQAVLIPNGSFTNNTTGWTSTTPDFWFSTTPSGLTDSDYLSLHASGGFTVSFTLSSPTFYLAGNLNYVFYVDFINETIGSMNNPLGGFQDVVLKDQNNNVVLSILSSGSQTSMFAGTSGLDLLQSNPFFLTSSGIYHLEFSGQAADNIRFDMDNVGFKEIIQSTFTGKVKQDINNDGCATGTAIANFPIQITETNSNNVYYRKTNSTGNYQIDTFTAGVHTTTPNNINYNSNPVNYTVTSPSTSPNFYSNQDFCVSTIATINDVDVTLVTTSSARPGFNASYRLIYTNNGTTTLNGLVNLTFDNSKVTLSTSTLPPNSQTTNTLEWNYSNLLPFESRYIDLVFSVAIPPIVNGGDALIYTTTVTPITDNVPSNNTFTLKDIAVNSYDPNDITVLEGAQISQQQASEYLNYIIRFQNTGTASAINIVVKNELDNFLDWTTFQPIAASHDFTTSVTDGNKVSFNFYGINLANKTSNEPASHGWVYYKIKPKTTFAVGDMIQNIANIYFDYNLPIITNNATTEISLLSTTENQNQNLNISPNPFKNNITILMKSKGIFTLSNINGQELKKGDLTNGDNSINLDYLPNGLYFFKVKTENETFIQKLIKQ